ncbi:long-chain fatty acid transport protein [Flavobacterium fryxellicola]|uniref:Hydrocarbon degradation protein n=1 Tax=Flavobacterium fryxellicola TaxID=249352 RepID=A0A167ZGJ5_9FLAO|nr:outer membrane protein transport protein [Flavobacterium fryxellicola]OAB30427.1 hydrocarbon degradation protein [Flavobacterium fryxellicola]SHN76475.1 long-chain fatty acid transport protein [Flavobacterium fryxellicola]
MKNVLTITSIFFFTTLFAQSGHLMQGVGAANMSMGGASTAQPIDISGALKWNPAAISAFEGSTISLNVGLFVANPQISSTVPTPNGPMSGTSTDVKSNSIMPSLGFVYGKKDSKHTFGAFAFGVSGFGVDFPESTTNPINMPQSMGGFGNLTSNYMMLQTGLSYAYKLSKSVSIGVSPNFNIATLELKPNPTANPTMAGYPTTNNAIATGFGGQIGIFYQNEEGFKLGASYKTEQQFSNFEFENTYLDNSRSENSFKMYFPAIYSLGVGYSNSKLDLAFDFRQVEYSRTEGFEDYGWSATGAVKGFGWKDMQVLSLGAQYKGIKKLPLRVGYTYNTNPIKPELAFFSASAPAVIQNAYQFGFGYEFSEKLTFNTVYHNATSDGSSEGPIYNPMLAGQTNPLGTVPNSKVSYKMDTSMLMLGITYKI